MKIRVSPRQRKIMITSPSSVISRTIHLSKAEALAVAEARTPYIIPRISALLSQLRKLEQKIVRGDGHSRPRSTPQTYIRMHAARVENAIIGRHVTTQSTRIEDTPDGPIKIRTMIRTNPNTGGSRTDILRINPRTGEVARTIIREDMPLGVSGTETSTTGPLYETPTPSPTHDTPDPT